MTLTPYNREYFSMQYFDQEVLALHYQDEVDYEIIKKVHTDNTRLYWDERWSKNSHLLLRELCSITLDECIDCLKIFGKFDKRIEHKIKYCMNTFNDRFARVYYDSKPMEPSEYMPYVPAQFASDFQVVMNMGNDFHSIHSNRGLVYLQAYQYLISKGFALPYHDLSVSKLIDIGWIKLRKEDITYERIG